MVITGGTRGIGAEVSRIAANGRMKICVTYNRNREAAINHLEQLEKLGAKPLLLQLDVTSQIEVRSVFEEVEEKLGPVSVLVNNAGIVGPSSRLDEIGDDRLRKMFDTNVLGTIYCCQEAVKRMSTKYGGAGGAIVNVSSVAAKLGSPGEYIDYAASKAAVDTLTIGLAKEVAEEGIRVNAVRPGIIYTDIHADSGDIGRPDKLKHLIPMKRPGNAEEVANAILWLASDEASYVTGSILDVSGGR